MYIALIFLLCSFFFKESSYTRQYAGISGDSIALYAEQTSEERFTEDVCDRLAEDINYKLRQIIHVRFFIVFYY